MLLSMLAAPFLIILSNAIALRSSGSEWLMQSLQMTQIATRAMAADKHVIICGYGRSGQNLARMLAPSASATSRSTSTPTGCARRLRPVIRWSIGDAARVQALKAAGLMRASAVVVTYLDTPSALKVLALAHEHAPTVPVMVRTIDDQDLDKLRQAGATEVVPEAIEASLMLASHALALVGVPMRRVIRLVQEQREQRYSLLRGYFHGADDSTAEELEQERLVTVTLPPAGRTLGRALGDMLLPVIGVRVVSLRRGNGKSIELQDDVVLQGGDTLVLSGKPEALALAEDKLVSGR
jgi:monovalent cation:H+ antiporter-2, CPA2 family